MSRKVFVSVCVLTLTLWLHTKSTRKFRGGGKGDFKFIEKVGIF